jgi:xanthine dehydrogenase accessory factor
VTIGDGEEVMSLAQLAQAHGALAEVYGSRPATRDQCSELGMRSQLITGRSTIAAIKSDPWTAWLFVSHEHDWEVDLIAEALSKQGFFIGAMGSRETAARRCAALHAMEVGRDEIARIASPVGLIPASRDAATFALSALAHISAAYQAFVYGSER